MRLDPDLALFPAEPISARTPACPASYANTGLSKGQAERTHAAAKGGELLEAARRRVPNGEAYVSFDADGRVTSLHVRDADEAAA
jgi:hypothetical protein